MVYRNCVTRWWYHRYDSKKKKGWKGEKKEVQTSKEAWDALEKAYDDKGLNRKVRLMKTLFSMKRDNFHNMERYVNGILSTSEQLAGIGKPLDDEYIGIIMLQGLPEEYVPMTMALEHSWVAITSDLVKTKLLQDTRSVLRISFIGKK